MQYDVIRDGQQNILELRSHPAGIGAKEASDIVGLCFSTECQALLLHASALSADFFTLRTGVLGEILQKMVNYHIRTALLLQSAPELSARFEELMLEANHGAHYRFFTERAAALDWLQAE